MQPVSTSLQPSLSLSSLVTHGPPSMLYRYSCFCTSRAYQMLSNDTEIADLPVSSPVRTGFKSADRFRGGEGSRSLLPSRLRVSRPSKRVQTSRGTVPLSRLSERSRDVNAVNSAHSGASFPLKSCPERLIWVILYSSLGASPTWPIHTPSQRL